MKVDKINLDTDKICLANMINTCYRKQNLLKNGNDIIEWI